jgi:iron(III) transport system substrate-binding protein
MARLGGRGVLAAIVAATAIGAGVSARADMQALEIAARKDGEITWYVASVDARTAEAAGEAFTARHGPKVNVVQAPAPVMFQRLTQDLAQKTPKADVFSSVNVGNFVTLKQSGALMAYRPQNAAKLLPAFQGLDRDGMFHATIASAVVIAYNSNKVTAKDAPRRWTDLNDPKWAGKIALTHPAFSGFAGNWATQMMKLYGKPFFQELGRQAPQVGRSLNDAVDLVASGERLLTVAPVAQVLEKSDKGKPLAVTYPADGAILVATPSAVLKSAPHPNAAKLFMEFLMGPEFGRILVTARYESMRADIAPLHGAKSVTEIRSIHPTLTESTQGVQLAAELWRSVFEPK